MTLPFKRRNRRIVIREPEPMAFLPARKAGYEVVTALGRFPKGPTSTDQHFSTGHLNPR